MRLGQRALCAGVFMCVCAHLIESARCMYVLVCMWKSISRVTISHIPIRYALYSCVCVCSNTGWMVTGGLPDRVPPGPAAPTQQQWVDARLGLHFLPRQLYAFCAIWLERSHAVQSFEPVVDPIHRRTLRPHTDVWFSGQRVVQRDRVHPGMSPASA